MKSKTESISIIDYLDLSKRTFRKKNPESKYNNVKVEQGGLVFDSKAEYRRWLVLSAMAKAGEISNLQRQVSFVLVPAQVTSTGRNEQPMKYICDFVYQKKDGRQVVEDVKGAATQVWRLKRKLMLHVHNIEVIEVRG